MLNRLDFLKSAFALSISSPSSFAIPKKEPITSSSYLEDEIKPFFITKAKLWKDVDFSNGESPFRFGKPDYKVSSAINAVCLRMTSPRLDHIAGRSINELANLIKSETENVIKDQGLARAPDFLHQWLLAEACVAWVRTHVVASHPEIAVESAKYEGWVRDSLSETILSRKSCVAVCSGRSVLLRDLARLVGKDIGLMCDYTGGFFRDLGGSVPETSNHAWVTFTFEGNLLVPSDHPPMELSQARRQKRKDHPWWCLPITPEHWELFLAQRYITTAGVPFGDQKMLSLIEISFEEWKKINTNYLIPLEKQLKAS